MADSVSITEIINQVALQVATVVMIKFRDTETGPQAATMQIQWGTQKADIWRTDTGEIKI